MYFLCVLFLAAADLISKSIADSKIKERKEIIQNCLYFTVAKNRGAAYNIFENKPQMVKILSGSALVTAAVYWIIAIKNEAVFLTAGLTFILGGALGNFIERLYKGSVTDFIYVNKKNAPIFNIADVCIAFGAFLFMVHHILCDE